MKAYQVIPSILQRIVWLPVRLGFKLFCHLEVSGLENVDEENNLIFASSHASELDPILIAVSLPLLSRHLPLFFTGQEKKFYKGMGWKRLIYGGRFFKAWGAYPVYVGLKNYEQALRHHIAIIRGGNSVCIFPTGKRTADGEPAKARGGVAFLAHKTQVPVVPVFIHGARGIMPQDFFLQRRKVSVIFGRPIHANDLFANSKNIVLNDRINDYEKAAAKIMKLVAPGSQRVLH